MTVKELIEILEKMNPDKTVKFLNEDFEYEDINKKFIYEIDNKVVIG